MRNGARQNPGQGPESVLLYLPDPHVSTVLHEVPRPFTWMKSFAVLALLAAAVLAAFLRLWDCPLCGGAVRRKLAEAADCPRCRDIGRVSSFTRAFRARPDPRVRALLERSPSFTDALMELSSGERPAVPGQVRFAVRDGEDVVVAQHTPASTIPGRRSAVAGRFGRRGGQCVAGDRIGPVVGHAQGGV